MFSVRAWMRRAVGEPLERFREHAPQRARVCVAGGDETARVELDRRFSRRLPVCTRCASPRRRGRGTRRPRRPASRRRPLRGHGASAAALWASRAARPRRRRRPGCAASASLGARESPMRVQVRGRDDEQRHPLDAALGQPAADLAQRANVAARRRGARRRARPVASRVPQQPLEVGELGGERGVPAVRWPPARRGSWVAGVCRGPARSPRSRSVGIAGAEGVDELADQRGRRRRRAVTTGAPQAAASSATSPNVSCAPGSTTQRARHIRGPAPRGRGCRARTRSGRSARAGAPARSRVSPAGPVPRSTSGHLVGAAAAASSSSRSALLARQPPDVKDVVAARDCGRGPERRDPVRAAAAACIGRHVSGAGSTTDMTASTSRYARRYQRRSARS